MTVEEGVPALQTVVEGGVVLGPNVVDSERSTEGRDREGVEEAPRVKLLQRQHGWLLA